jgi:hypothetical protein
MCFICGIFNRLTPSLLLLNHASSFFMELKVKGLKDVVVEKVFLRGSGNFATASCSLPGMGTASIQPAKMGDLTAVDALKRRLQL